MFRRLQEIFLVPRPSSLVPRPPSSWVPSAPSKTWPSRPVLRCLSWWWCCPWWGLPSGLAPPGQSDQSLSAPSVDAVPVREPQESYVHMYSWARAQAAGYMAWGTRPHSTSTSTLSTSRGGQKRSLRAAHACAFPYNPESLRTLDFETSTTRLQSLQHISCSHVGPLLALAVSVLANGAATAHNAHNAPTA